MVFALILIAFCVFLLLLSGDFAGIGTLLAVFGGIFVLLLVYVGVRSAIDPEYAKRIEREAEEERKRKREKDAASMRRAAKPGGWLYYARRNGFAPKK